MREKRTKKGETTEIAAASGTQPRSERPSPTTTSTLDPTNTATQSPSPSSTGGAGKMGGAVGYLVLGAMFAGTFAGLLWLEHIHGKLMSI